MDAADLEWITSTVVAEVRNGARSPAAVFVLLHAYARAGALPVRAALEPLLTGALGAAGDRGDAVTRCEWLGVISQAAAFSDDERLVGVIDAQLPEAIDALERHVAAVYIPGEPPDPGQRGVHIRTANALLTAFDLTGRTPYPMLAEELLQAWHRDLPHDETSVETDPFDVACDVVTACCRMVQLHRDPEYVARAVVAREPRYHEAAERRLTAMAAVHRQQPRAAAEYGRALIHWLALRAHPN